MTDHITKLSKRRYNKAIETLDNAKQCLQEGQYRLASNRSYYIIFYAICAVNALDEFNGSKHSDIIAHFDQYHVQNGDFPKKVSVIIKNASKIREHPDYESSFPISKEEAEFRIKRAATLLTYVKEYLTDQSVLEEK